MKTLLYSIVVLFTIIWAIGFFVYAIGVIIHTLLILAFILILINASKRKNIQA